MKQNVYCKILCRYINTHRTWHNETLLRKSASWKTDTINTTCTMKMFTSLLYAAILRGCVLCLRHTLLEIPESLLKSARQGDAMKKLIRFHCTMNPDNEIERISHVISTTGLVKLIFYLTQKADEDVITIDEIMNSRERDSKCSIKYFYYVFSFFYRYMNSIFTLISIWIQLIHLRCFISMLLM